MPFESLGREDVSDFPVAIASSRVYVCMKSESMSPCPCAMALWYFYVCFILQLDLVAGQTVHYVLKGKEAILTPSLSRVPDDILWKHNGDKVITFDSAQESVYGDYKDRVTLAWDTAELAISDVRYDDSGEYELDALIRDRLHRTQFMLKVLDKVSKPVITCQINDESSLNKTSGLRATLLCSSESNTPEALTYKWNLDGKYQLGQALTIPLGDEHDEIEYSCTVNNPLHAETSIYLAKDCHTVRTTEALDVVVPILIALLILLAFGTLFVIFRHQLKKMCCTKTENGDLEKQIGAAMRNTDERKPLMNLHRQETVLSQQRLPQTDDEIVKETPQNQKIKKDLEELQTSECVKKKKNIFEKNGQTEELLDSQTKSLPESTPQTSAADVIQVLWFGSDELEDKGQNESSKESNTEPQKDLSSINSDQNKAKPSDLQKPPADSDSPGGESHTDHDEEATSQPATPSMMPKCGPDELGSSGQQDLIGEPENNTEKTDEAGDTSSIESEEEEEFRPAKDTTPKSSTSNIDQDSQLEPGEDERKGQTHSKDMGHSDDNTQNTDEAGRSSSEEESSNESSKNSDETAQYSPSKPSEDESKGQADSEGEPDLDHSGDNAQKTNATEEPSMAPEETGLPQIEHNAPSIDQEPESKEQEDTNEKSNRDSRLEEGLKTGQPKHDSISSDHKEPVLTVQSDTAQNKEPTDQKQEITKDIEDLKKAENVKKNVREIQERNIQKLEEGSVKKTKDKTEDGVQSEVVPVSQKGDQNNTDNRSEPETASEQSVSQQQVDLTLTHSLDSSLSEHTDTEENTKHKEDIISEQVNNEMTDNTDSDSSSSQQRNETESACGGSK